MFANEEEAKAFTGKEPEEALDVIAKMCSIAIVKLGARGSLIRKGTEEVHVHAVTVDRVIDTTGAGDYFAAWFFVWTDLWIFIGEMWQDRFYPFRKHHPGDWCRNACRVVGRD